MVAVSGVPGPIVSGRAGHTHLTTADNVYLHPTAEDLKQGYDKLKLHPVVTSCDISARRL
jgi:hypothetical protein